MKKIILLSVALIVLNKLNVSGQIQSNVLAGNGNVLLQTDNNGNIITIPGGVGTSSQVLLGNLQWGTLPAASPWSAIGNNIYNSNSGNVGIGTNNPQYNLDVTGTVNATGGFYINGVAFTPTQWTNLNSDIMFNSASNGGNVGIGTSPGSGYKLDVAGTIHTSGNMVVDGNIQTSGSTSAISLSSGAISLQNAGGDNFTLNGVTAPTSLSSPKGINISAGETGFTLGNINNALSAPQSPCNLGYGTVGNFTSCDQEIFVAAGNHYVTGPAGSLYNPIMQSSDNGIFWSDEQGATATLGSGVKNLSSGFVIAPWSGSTAGIRISASGKVSIGTNNVPLNSIYNLFVAGGVETEAVNIALQGTSNWADYVFKDSYKLMPIKEVEKFVSKNKHLPDVPSESEVKKTGVDVVQMDATLLKKIEELTLYVIQQQKEIDELKKKSGN